MFSGDLGTQLGDPPALTDADLTEAALEAESLFRQTSSLTAFTATVRRLAELAPRTVAIMHGASYSGDGAEMLSRLAAAYEEHFSDLDFATNPGRITDLAGSDETTRLLSH